MIFQETYKIGMEDIGISNRATNQAIIAMMEDVGSQHSDTVGYGVLDVETKKRAWVLLDWKVHIIKRPVYKEQVSASTWARKVDRVCAYRDFEIKGTDGNKLAIGSSRWLMIDTQNRRPIRLSPELMEMYGPEEGKMAFDEEIEDIRLTQEWLQSCDSTYTMNYQVQRRDIDINQHMHNLSYLDVAYEALPEAVYTDNQFDNIRISYKKEITYGEHISCVYVQEGKKHVVCMKNGEKVHAVIELS